jgi:hypothetical protein
VIPEIIAPKLKDLHGLYNKSIRKEEEDSCQESIGYGMWASAFPEYNTKGYALNSSSTEQNDQ